METKFFFKQYSRKGKKWRGQVKIRKENQTKGDKKGSI